MFAKLHKKNAKNAAKAVVSSKDLAKLAKLGLQLNVGEGFGGALKDEQRLLCVALRC